MSALEMLTPAGKKRKRVGRGGSRGGTAGKGHKGQKARSGPKIPIQFEGGQMPLTRRLPKRGFNNTVFRAASEIIDISVIHEQFNDGETVTPELLFEKGLIKGGRRLLKVLGNSAVSKKLVVHADKFSKGASSAIEKAGGKVHVKEVPVNKAVKPVRKKASSEAQAKKA